MPCPEMQELEASNNRYNENSMSTLSLISNGRHDSSKWHRAGGARLAFIMQMHRQNCDKCRRKG
jgi:hypothetical protein